MTQQATKQKRNLPSAVRRDLKKKRLSTLQPLKRQEYYLDLPDVWLVDPKTGIGKWVKNQLKLNPEDYFNLVSNKLAEVRKDKMVDYFTKTGSYIYSYRLIVVRFTDIFRGKCRTWQHQGNQSITVQLLREFQESVDFRVAKALESFMSKVRWQLLVRA